MLLNRSRAVLGRARPALIPLVVVAALAAGVSLASASTPRSKTAAATSATKWPTAAQEVASSGIEPSVKFCGTKHITLAVEDGFGINAWSQESYAAVKSTAAECPNVKVLTYGGGGVESTAIQDINSAVAQGAKAMTIIPDFGSAELPAIEAAKNAGVKAVPWASTTDGKNGSDYVAYVDWNNPAAATGWAEWMVKALHGKGNVIFLGGPAGTPYAAQQLPRIVAVFRKYPKMHLLTGTTPGSYLVTNWDPATAETVTAAALAQYPVINGVIANYGTDALAAAQAFEKAGRKLVPTATLDANGLSCLFKAKKIPLLTYTSRNWLGRVAARKAIAAAEGLPNHEPDIYTMSPFENTLAGLTYQCVKSAPADYYVSNKLTLGQLAKYGKS
jgi:ribose transport system substrate-binding protein